MTDIAIRPFRESDYESLQRVLNLAFSNYRDATRYHESMLQFYREWMWSDGTSLALASDEALYGVLMAGYREATFEEKRLRIVHIGPAGIVPRHRRKGLGTDMMRQAIQHAREAGADLLTLTTEAAYGAHRMYRRAGFDVLEAYRPLVAGLAPNAPTQPLHEAVRLSDTWTSSPHTQPPEKCIQEIGPLSPPPPTKLRPRQYEHQGGLAKTLQWPVLSRRGSKEELSYATQLVHWEPGENPQKLLDTVLAIAQNERSICVYALRSTADTLPGFSTRGAPLVYRMVRALTDQGHDAVRNATRYYEICPAP